jgi:galacturonosyltransferase
MKILILANNDVGLYQFRGDLIRTLQKNHEVTISLPYGPLVDPLTEAGCHFLDTPIDRRGLNPVTDLKLLRKYKKMLKAERPDLVITYTIKPNIYGAMACKSRKIPYAVNITGLGTAFQGQGILRKLVTFLYKTALKKAKVVFFENSANRQLFIDEGIVPAEKTCLLSGAGVNLHRFAPAPYPADGRIHFLFVGRVMKEKGIGELFAAMEKLTTAGHDCCLDVLGLHEENMDDMIRQGQAAGWLNYHGYQADVRPFIERAHCFVLPSYHEGMANTNLECAAMARPLITSDIPGCREAVMPASGMLCKPQDADSLYFAMEAFLRLPHSQKAAMGTAGRTHMEAVFDKEKVVQATLDALNL